MIVNKKDGKILLIKSHKWGDVYLLPGGHVEHEETVLGAAKREGEEETGLKLKPLYCVNVGELINSPLFHRKAHLVFFHIVCEAETDKVKLDGVELNHFIWIKPEEALKLKNIRVKKTIQNYIDGAKIDIANK
ncbi:MAG: NUDIX domain-containing protein [Patescibacteria group bacterium]